MISVLPRLLPLIARAGAVATAGIIGWKIGKKLDKWLEISKKFNAFIGREDKKTNELAKTTWKVLQEQVVIAKTKAGTTEAFTSKEKIALLTQLGKFGMERKKDLGFFGRSNLLAINVAQEKFIQEHINEYLEYGARQVEQLRVQWLKEGGYKGKFIGTSAIKYGKQREKAFLEYLKRKGKPLSVFDKNKQILSYKSKYGTKKFADSLRKTTEDKVDLKHLNIHDKSVAQTKIPEVIERLKKTSPEVREYLKQCVTQYKSIAQTKIPEVIDHLDKDTPEIKVYVKKLAIQLVSQNKSVTEEIKGQNKLLKELSRESSQKINQGIHKSTAVISQNVSNITTVLQTNNKRAQRLTNDTYDIIYGRLSQNRPLQ